jgi:hypothetical protein
LPHADASKTALADPAEKLKTVSSDMSAFVSETERLAEELLALQLG